MILIILASVILSTARCQPDDDALVDSIHPRSRRSIGALPTSIENYPYVVSVRYSGTHTCGGTILTKDVILTAAQCVSNAPLDLLSVKAGDADINYKGTWHSVAKVVKHENNQTSNQTADLGSGDIALLKLENPIVLNNETTGIVQLFEPGEDVHDYDRGILVGWGSVPVVTEAPDLKSNQTIKKKVARFSSKLSGVELNIASKSKCSEIDPSKSFENLFCTYSLGRKPCTGDIGSPLIVKERQAGFVTYDSTMDCSENSNTGYYIEVASYRKWIDENVKVLSKPE